MLDRVGKDVKNKAYTLSGEVQFHVKIKGKSTGIPRTFDSYLKVYLSPYSLPKLPYWYAGDAHYHSSYSDNAVEFGGPIGATLKMGKAIGLGWTVITDHSFDLDDVNQTRQTNDPNDKWNSLRSEVSAINDPIFKMILGEEVSAGNALDMNVHFLCYGLEDAPTFIPGDGDDRWDHKDADLTQPCSSCTPTITLIDAISRCNSYGGGYAAHPTAYDADSVYYLNRGNWTVNDYALTGYKGLQIWNTIRDPWTYFEEGMKVWVTQLLNERRLFIAGGSDAHGDFSNASEYNPRELKVIYHNNSFGRVRTYVYTTYFSNTGILEALKRGHSIITDGPLVVFDINGIIIGDNVYGTEGDNLNLNIKWLSTQEFGAVDKITVIKGDIISKNETVITEIAPGRKEWYSGSKQIPIITNANTYYRLNATTTLRRMAFTNPIWIVVDKTPPIISRVVYNGSIINSTTVEKGTTAAYINWTISEMYPNTYTIYRNNTIIASGRYTDGQIITQVIDASAGMHGDWNYTIVAKDEAGNPAQDSVVISVVDTTPPFITVSVNETVEKGEKFNITIIIEEFQPDMLAVKRFDKSTSSWIIINSTKYLSDVEYNIVDVLFEHGEHNYTIIANDTAGNYAEFNFTIMAVDTTPPNVTIEAPSIVDEGDIFTVNVTIIELQPDSYNLTRNETLVDSGSYSSGTKISIAQDSALLRLGSFVYKACANDTVGNSACSNATVRIENVTEINCTDLPGGNYIKYTQDMWTSTVTNQSYKLINCDTCLISQLAQFDTFIKFNFEIDIGAYRFKMWSFEGNGPWITQVVGWADPTDQVGIHFGGYGAWYGKCWAYYDFDCNLADYNNYTCCGAFPNRPAYYAKGFPPYAWDRDGYYVATKAVIFMFKASFVCEIKE